VKTNGGIRRYSYTCEDNRRQTWLRFRCSQCPGRGISWIGRTVFSSLAIVPGVIAIGVRENPSGVLLILCAVAGAVLGGTFATIGVILALTGVTFAALDGQGKVEAVAPAAR
jgi:hypothetical protein